MTMNLKLKVLRLFYFLHLSENNRKFSILFPEYSKSQSFFKALYWIVVSFGLTAVLFS